MTRMVAEKRRYKTEMIKDLKALYQLTGKSDKIAEILSLVKALEV